MHIHMLSSGQALGSFAVSDNSKQTFYLQGLMANNL